MPNFLEEVFAEQERTAVAAPAVRRRLPGLANPKVYAVILAALAALTAIPTWIIMWSGAAQLDQGAVPVRPLLPSLTSPEAPLPRTPPLLIPPPVPRADAGQAKPAAARGAGIPERQPVLAADHGRAPCPRELAQ